MAHVELRELTPEEHEARHFHAKRLRNDPGFIAAVESAKKQIMKEICETRPDQADVREALYFEQRALSRLEGRLSSLGTTHLSRDAHRSIA